MASYDDLSLEELRDLCKERDLKVSGNKDELVARLELADIEAEERDGDDSTPVDVADDGDVGDNDVDDDPDDDPDDDGSDDPAGGGDPGPDSEDFVDATAAPVAPPQPTAEAAVAGIGATTATPQEPRERPESPPVDDSVRVRPVRGNTPQEGPQVSGAFQYAVLPDGRRVAFEQAADGADDGAEDEE